MNLFFTNGIIIFCVASALIRPISAPVLQKMTQAAPYALGSLLPIVIDTITQKIFNSSASFRWSNYVAYIPGLISFSAVCILSPQSRVISTICYLSCTVWNLRREWVRAEIQNCQDLFKTCKKWNLGTNREKELLQSLVQGAKKCKYYPQEYRSIVETFFKYLPSSIDLSFKLEIFRDLLEACPTGEQGKEPHVQLLRYLVQEAKKYQWNSQEQRKVVRVFCRYLPFVPLENYFPKDGTKSAIDELSTIKTHRDALGKRWGAQDSRMPLLGSLIIHAHQSYLEACPAGEGGRDQRIQLLESLVKEAGKYPWGSEEHKEIVEIFVKQFSLLPPSIDIDFIIKTHRDLLEDCPVAEQGKEPHIRLLKLLIQQAKKYKWGSREHRGIVKVFCHYLPH